MNRKQRRAESKHVGPAVSPAVTLLFAAALQCHQAGHLTEAEMLYRQVLALNCGHADALHLLGVVAYQTARHDLAADMIGQAIAIDAGQALYYSNLGNVFAALRRLDEAVACCRRALALKPDYAEAHNNLGIVLAEQGLLEEAVACYRRALALRPDYPEAFNNLGIALKDQGSLDEAVACCRRAADLWPRYAEAHNNLGNALEQQGRLDEAADGYRAAIGFKPDYPVAHTNLAMLLLARGDMAAGWAEYEWRWRQPGMAADRRSFAPPQWRGEAAAGRTLLIHAEQGFGDTLQFCRYATLAAASGLRVILEVQAPLVRLLRSLAGVEMVVARGEELPAFDLHCPMLSLALGTTVTTIPAAAAYLHADKLQVAAWRARLAAMATQGLRVGLVWAGGRRTHSPSLAATDRRRSMPPDRLAPLFELSGVHFFSLQKGGPAAPANFPLTDFMEEMGDFADTAALIANLDLVISVDTAIAHLAAALGKPVWLLNRFDSCWRWLRQREDSPWYPTLRQFRQTQPGDWHFAVEMACTELRRLAGEPLIRTAPL